MRGCEGARVSSLTNALASEDKGTRAHGRAGVRAHASAGALIFFSKLT